MKPWWATKEHWRKSYETGYYSQRWHYQYPGQELVAVVAAGLIPKGGTVLDIGCGAGTEAIFLSQCGFLTIGLDYTYQALKIAEKNVPPDVEVHWCCGNSVQLPIKSQSIAFANDRGCFHVVTEDNRPQYVQELARVLIPGSHLLLCGRREPNDYSSAAVTEEDIIRYFTKPLFKRCGPILPIMLISDSSTLDANIVILEKL